MEETLSAIAISMGKESDVADAQFDATQEATLLRSLVVGLLILISSVIVAVLTIQNLLATLGGEPPPAD